MESAVMLLLVNQLFRSLNRNLSKLLHQLHEVKSSLTSASAGSLVTLLYLSLSVLCEYLILCLDLIYKCFHVLKILVIVKRLASKLHEFIDNVSKKQIFASKIV